MESFDVQAGGDEGARELLPAQRAGRPFGIYLGIGLLGLAAAGSVCYYFVSGMGTEPSPGPAPPGPIPPEPPSLPELETYVCESDLALGPVSKSESKGLCLDATTFSKCSGKIPQLWPHTDDKITSLRLFAPWRDAWPEDDREQAWDNLHAHLVANPDIKILLGTDITCDESADARMWAWTKQLIKKIGSDRLMGLAIGNQVDLVSLMNPPDGCLRRLWSEDEGHGSFMNLFFKGIEELESEIPDFKDVPITTVLSLYSFSGNPFLDDPTKGKFNTFLTKALQKYRTRFVFSFNVFPYFDDGNHIDPGKADECYHSLLDKTCFDNDCFMNRLARDGRRKIMELQNSIGDPGEYYLWLGESGWSSPVSDTTQKAMKACPAWSSQQAFTLNYDNWLQWDLKLDQSGPTADHAFFSAARDGIEGNFGLIEGCESVKCKFQKPPTTTTTTLASSTTSTTTEMSTTTTTRAPGEAYNCHSDLQLGPIQTGTLNKKGMCMDDTTFSTCAGDIPELYPNTKDKVKSLRLFAPWKVEWPPENRLPAWDRLKQYLEANDAKILLGAEITCYPDNDDVVWAWTKELIKKIGPHHVLGLAIGNEMDLLHFKSGGDPPFVPAGCIRRLWADQDGPQSFVSTFFRRIEDMDQFVPGFNQVPITSVWSLYCHAAEPFLDNDNQVTAKSFFTKAINKYGKRFVFAFNIYPYFDPANDWMSCQDALNSKLCFTAGCFTNNLAIQCRNKMNALLREMGRQDEQNQYKLWIGESGWSHPVSSTTQRSQRDCYDWSSKETFMKNYNGWLTWDLTLPGTADVDHSFFFTMRDAYNFGEEEHFGLIYKCGDTQCKLQPDTIDV